MLNANRYMLFLGFQSGKSLTRIQICSKLKV